PRRQKKPANPERPQWERPSTRTADEHRGRFRCNDSVAARGPSIGLDGYPNVLTPAFVVPGSILLHALSLRQLRRRSRAEASTGCLNGGDQPVDRNRATLVTPPFDAASPSTPHDQTNSRG